MKPHFLISFAMVSILSIQAQDVKLPAVNLNQKSLSMVKTLSTRHSVREYDNTPLTLQSISNLCWAACGVSRDADHRTYPSAMNKKEIRLFLFTAEKVYEYLAPTHTLHYLAKGDYRHLVAGDKNGFSQDFVLTAPVSLVMVIDFDLMGQKDERSLRMGCVDAGNVSENINLYCQSVGLVTVPRATMDVEGLRELLHLSENQLPIMNNPVGLPKK